MNLPFLVEVLVSVITTMSIFSSLQNIMHCLSLVVSLRNPLMLCVPNVIAGIRLMDFCGALTGMLFVLGCPCVCTGVSGM